ncbi:MAG: hypothetical protein K8U03_24150 [Planctomycetia bacterium]|nr:hypothetical protein [Planctomycetia bacterium]
MQITSQTDRCRLPSIYSIFHPIEEYWNSCRPDRRDEVLTDFINPVDVMLAHSILDKLIGKQSVVDLSAFTNEGVGSILSLRHPNVSDVVVLSEESNSGKQVRRSLEEFASSHCKGRSHLNFSTKQELSPWNTPKGPVVVLVNAKGIAAAHLTELIECWVTCSHDTILLLFDIGVTGKCPIIEALVTQCGISSPFQLHLTRELSDAFVSSRLAVVASKSNSEIERALLRIRQQYAGNNRMVDLLNASNLAQIRDKNLDTDLLRRFPNWSATHKVVETDAAHSVARRLIRIRERIAPDHSLRYRAMQLTLRANCYWRTHGFVRMIHAAAKRCLGIKR